MAAPARWPAGSSCQRLSVTQAFTVVPRAVLPERKVAPTPSPVCPTSPLLTASLFTGSDLTRYVVVQCWTMRRSDPERRHQRIPRSSCSGSRWVRLSFSSVPSSRRSAYSPWVLRPELPHAGDVDNRGAMDAGESARVRSGLEVTERLAEVEQLPLGVDLHVVVLRRPRPRSMQHDGLRMQ